MMNQNVDEHVSIFFAKCVSFLHRCCNWKQNETWRIDAKRIKSIASNSNCVLLLILFLCSNRFSIFRFESQRNRSACTQISAEYMSCTLCNVFTKNRLDDSRPRLPRCCLISVLFSFFSCCDRSHSLWSSIQFTFCQAFFFFFHSRSNERFVYASRIIYWLLMSNGYLFIVCLMNYSRCLLFGRARASARSPSLPRFFFMLLSSSTFFLFIFSTIVITTY